MSEHNGNETLVIFCKVVIVIVFVYPLLHYALFNKSQDDEPKNQAPSNETQETRPSPNKKRTIIQQPACPTSYFLIVLQDLCKDLFLLHSQCTPEDFGNLEKHKIPKNNANNHNNGEPRGTIVGCVAAGLLLTSLGAAFLELYKAKSQTPVKHTKPLMNRKCSLADLTVLKHHRKELVRRESIMELPENGATSVKPMAFRPPPLSRRCSFPIGPSESEQSYNTYQESRRASVDSRRLSIIDSRRGSVDCRIAPIDARRMSIDNGSPERRHWSRLVHRH